MTAGTSHVRAGQPELFLDDEQITRSACVTRTWHQFQKHPANPLFMKSGHEVQLFLFGTVIREPEPGGDGTPVFRMWYYAAGQGMCWTAYARSYDGLEWKKPELGLVAINGCRANNAVFMPGNWKVNGLAGIVRDPGDVSETDRYKLVQVAGMDDEKAYLLATSPDGIGWTLRGTFTPGKPCKPDRACFCWDPFTNRYVLYNRIQYAPTELAGRGGPAYWGRAVALCSTEDFLDWPVEARLVVHADGADADGTEIYGMSAFPYGGQWIGLPQIHRSLPELAWIDVSIAHSRDGVSWRRERELVLPRGGVGEWDRFNQCAATRPVIVDDEIWVYYSGRMYRHGEYNGYPDYKPDLARDDSGPYSVGIGLATLRLDGWCSLQADFSGGIVETSPVILPPGDLYVNVKADWGEVVVEIIDADSGARVGVKSEPIRSDGVRVKVEWPAGRSIDTFRDKPVRARFHLVNAHIYSWVIDLA